MSCGAAVSPLVCYGPVPKKLIRWYVTSVGLLRAYQIRQELLVCPLDILKYEAVTGGVRQPETFSGFSEQWKVAQPLLTSAFHLILVGLNGCWGVGLKRTQSLGGSDRRKEEVLGVTGAGVFYETINKEGKKNL